MTVSDLLEQPRNKSDNAMKLVTTHVKTHKLLQICSQSFDKLCSNCLFPVVVTSLEQAVLCFKQLVTSLMALSEL